MGAVMSFNGGFNFVMMFGRVIAKSFKAGQEWRERKDNATPAEEMIPIRIAAYHAAKLTADGVLLMLKSNLSSLHKYNAEYLAYYLPTLDTTRGLLHQLPKEVQQEFLERQMELAKKELRSYR
jgi:hypothetical protein